ncbi:glycogen biosynthesis protein GlgD [Rossellomorea oryzaecorticis]|uniref:Glycogen biosynthesis protein GlgD n=1 Tax=Rossellomorea oryzaecorticis TaxID=1396505 RepID=A0ABU9KAU6_9BACI
MKKRSKQNNPEQKTRSDFRNLDTEFGAEQNTVKTAKKKYEKQGQPVKSKQNNGK